MRDYVIKICGIRHIPQAIKIADFGATHIGMIYFPKSPRHIEIPQIQSIASAIKGKAKSVAVVVNPELSEVRRLLNIVDIIQFHGDEDIEFVKNFPKERVFKAFRIKDEKDINKMEPFFKEGYTVLIDAFSEKAYGGTGKQIDRDIAKKVIDMYDRVILSGGLSPENLEELLKELKPYGVDASSKLEKEPGIKDLEKTRRFIEIVRKYYEPSD